MSDIIIKDSSKYNDLIESYKISNSYMISNLSDYLLDADGIHKFENNMPDPDWEIEEQEFKNIELFLKYFSMHDRYAKKGSWDDHCFFSTSNSTKKCITTSYGSYVLKHSVESFISKFFPERNSYVSNGALIIYMTRCGYNIVSQRTDRSNHSINAYFNIRKKTLSDLSNYIDKVHKLDKVDDKELIEKLKIPSEYRKEEV